MKDINDWARFFGTPVKRFTEGKEGVGPLFFYDRSFVPLAVCNQEQKHNLVTAFEGFRRGSDDYHQTLFRRTSQGDDYPNFGISSAGRWPDGLATDEESSVEKHLMPCMGPSLRRKTTTDGRKDCDARFPPR